MRFFLRIAMTALMAVAAGASIAGPATSPANQSSAVRTAAADAADSGAAVAASTPTAATKPPAAEKTPPSEKSLAAEVVPASENAPAAKATGPSGNAPATEGITPSAVAIATPATLIGPQLPVPDTKDRRCTADGRSCIQVTTYIADVCTTIEKAATENRLDPNFLARLLWKESMFEPEAVSPVGALGIAQFMPETARIRKLDDPFNPAKAIHASADYLRYLTDGFGNIGLAAVAYNGGEGRALRFFKGGQVLPYETQDYVEAITGHNAWKWRDEPPAELDMRLDSDKPFHDACIKLAGNRTLREFATKKRVWPWGVILASHPKQSGAQQQVNRLNRQLRPILGGRRISYVRKTMTGSGRRVYTAQVGYSSRGEANAFCTQFRALGGRCIVLKN